MIASLVLVSLVIFSGTIATYLYDDPPNIGARLCAGACTGLAALGLIGFVVASFLGLTTVAILLTIVICCVPLLALLNPDCIKRVRQDLEHFANAVRRLTARPTVASLGYVLFYASIIIVFWRVFDRAMIQDQEGIGTGLLNNFGDLPFHLSVVTGFAYGENFPPQDPTYAGIRFTYPFLTDFISAVFVRCGADLGQSMFIENFILAISFVGLLHRWALAMLKDRLAAVITPLLVLLNGGFGWILLFSKAADSEKGLWGVLSDLPPSFTVIPETTWRWGNAVSALLVPQRGFLMGLPLAIIVFTQWWLATEKVKGKKDVRESARNARPRKPEMFESNERFPLSVRRMIAAGVAAGFLPLVHAHSFVVVMAMGACLALLQIKWREWIAFFITASVIAIPQLLWSTSHSAVSATSFFGFEIGWDRGQDNPIWFWFKNTGFFIPLILVAVLIRGKDYLISKRLLIFYLPFTLCFIVPNFLKMAPWIWDNIKVLFYWWVASAPLVAMLLSRLWREGDVRRAIAVVLFVFVTLAGALDVAGIAFGSARYGIFDAAAVQFAELVKEKTPPQSLIVHAPVHNTPVFLTGRRSLMGYPGHIWTHGLDFIHREGEIKRIYAGAPDAEALLRFYDIDYAVVGPQERYIPSLNEQFFNRYEKIGEVGDYKLFKIKRP